MFRIHNNRLQLAYTVFYYVDSIGYAKQSRIIEFLSFKLGTPRCHVHSNYMQLNIQYGYTDSIGIVIFLFL